LASTRSTAADTDAADGDLEHRLNR
jgi:hypothetical protein